MSNDRWVGKEDVVHIHDGILLSHKKEWNWAICRDVGRPTICHTEWSKSEREKQIWSIHVRLNISPLLWWVLRVYTAHHSSSLHLSAPDYSCSPTQDTSTVTLDLSTTRMKPWWPLNFLNHVLSLTLHCPLKPYRTSLSWTSETTNSGHPQDFLIIWNHFPSKALVPKITLSLAFSIFHIFTILSLTFAS